MTCYSPLQAYRVHGRKKLLFTQDDTLPNIPVKVPCGQCVGCRIDRSRQWAVRCVHEASLYERNCFITLTFNDDNLPSPPNLDVRTFQLFMKRLRKAFGDGIRFYHCGEYGEQFGRPHYHALLFNFDFPDKYLWKVYNGSKLYRSPILERLWPYGHSSIGDVTFQSAAYVARYVMKKVTGKGAEKYYASCPKTGEVFDRKSEYTTMSRRPGIGREWFEKFKNDVFPNDQVLIKSGDQYKAIKPPRYYDNLFELSNPEDILRVKSVRKKNALKHSADQTPERLKVKEICKLKQVELLKRNVE